MVVAAGAAVLFGLVWAAGEISGWLFIGGRPGLGIVGLGGVLWRFPSNLRDPAGAWPDPESIPGPVAFWSVAAVLLLAVTAGLWFLWRAVRPPPSDDARFAVRRDLASLRVRRPKPGRLSIGRSAAGGLLATESSHSLMVVGPTQTGKTTGLAIPAILEWDGPVLATSVKADLAEHTFGRRSDVGTVWVYDPAAVTGYECAPWSPLSACHTWVDSMAIASDLVEAAKVAATGSEREAVFWYETAAELLAPYLFAAARAPGRTMADIARWVHDHERTVVAQILDDLGSAEAANAFAGFWKGDSRTVNNIFTQLTILLKVYRDPMVAASATGTGITPAGLLSGSNTLYVTAPASAQKHLRPLFTTLVADVISTAYATAAAQGGRLAKPLLVVLDEAANIAPVPDLAQVASTCSSHGIQLVTVWQDLAQIEVRYPGEHATVVNNHRAKLFLSGIADIRTLDYVSRLSGDTTEPADQNRLFAPKRDADSGRRRPLIAADHIRQQATGDGILIYGSIPPAAVSLRPWYKNWRLRRLTKPGGKAAAVDADTTGGDV